MASVRVRVLLVGAKTLFAAANVAGFIGRLHLSGDAHDAARCPGKSPHKNRPAEVAARIAVLVPARWVAGNPGLTNGRFLPDRGGGRSGPQHDRPALTRQPAPAGRPAASPPEFLGKAGSPSLWRMIAYSPGGSGSAPCGTMVAATIERIEEKVRAEITERILREAGFETQVADAIAAISKLDELLWMILKTRDMVPSERLIRLALSGGEAGGS
jgi:hypothetical protein